MIHFVRRTLWTLCLVFLLFLLTTGISADDDGKRHRYREHRRGNDNHYGVKYLKSLSNNKYTDHCGACHCAYQPGLLPTDSWRKILENSEDHFGEILDLGC